MYAYIRVHRDGHMLPLSLVLLFGGMIATLNKNPLGDVPREIQMFQPNQKVNTNDILTRVELSSRNDDLHPCRYLGKADLCYSPLGDMIPLF